MNVRLKRNRGRSAVVAFALALCLLSSNAAPSRAAVNHPGTFADQPEVNCQPDDMWVWPPLMGPASVQYNDPGFSHGDPYSLPAQWVAFRADLYWWNGSEWVFYREGAWFYQQAATTHVILGVGNGWFEWTTSNPVNYTLGFWDLPNSGDYQNPNYYAVYYNYYWFPDKFRDGGSVGGYTHNHKDNRAQPETSFNYVQNSNQYCKYPGPNWVLNLN